MIEIIKVSKKFRIWEDRSRDLKETAINWVRGKKRSYRELWALRGVDLEIREGESVAFIGENGSGKSTLLKLLCKIYTPDEGRIVTKGKISTLLELGVGFHPDLTGEENVYLNGAMLGFNRSDMEKKFDEVVSFSEIGDFIYSPIRTYSSGMLMRLGFSVAMCVDPDILLIDEILAVGDEAFQNKCLERLEGFKSAGKTIIIVSHALKLVKDFCQRTILLKDGKVMADGNPEAVIDRYHAILSTKERPPELEKLLEEERISIQGGIPVHPLEGERKETEETAKEEIEKEEVQKEGAEIEEIEKEETQGEEVGERKPDEVAASPIPEYRRYGTFEATITGVVIKTDQEEETGTFLSEDLVSIRLHIRFHRDIENPVVGISILQYENGINEIYSTNTLWRNVNTGGFKENTEIEVDFVQKVSLPEGEYYLTVAVANTDISRFLDWQENIRSFRVKKGSQPWRGKVDLNSQIFISRSSYQNGN